VRQATVNGNKTVGGSVFDLEALREPALRTGRFPGEKRMIRKIVVLVVAGWLLASGCGAAGPAEPALPEMDSGTDAAPEAATNSPPRTEQPAPATPVIVDFGALEPEREQDSEGEEGMEAPAPGVRDPGAQLVKAAQQALADRLGASADAISVELVEEVTWPDSGLGCPEPGMMYLQVLTPGYRIVLSAEGAEYVYHTDRSKRLVLCGADGTPLE
jgi:hypothetical protein